MNETPCLRLPYILPSQSQKHVTHNEALRMLDALVQLAVLDRDLESPPGSPADGDRYIVAADATGGWADHDGQIAAWQDGAWAFLVPRTGWCAVVADEQVIVWFDGTQWTLFEMPAGAELQELSLLGLGTTADAVNPFSAKLNKALWTARTAAEGGDGDLRYTLNKEAPGNTSSLLFQSGFSGCAEVGLAGDDDLRIKVSPDGSTWTQALAVSRASGLASFAQGIAHPATGLPVAQLLPCPTVPEIWRSDASRAATPRTYTVASVSGNQVTLTTAGVPEFFHGGMRGVSMARIWNTSKTPAEAAWVTWNDSTTQFSVHVAAAVSSWSSGDTLRLGDPNPTGSNTLGMIAIDISPYLQAAFGAVFRQRGVLLATYASGAGGDVSIDGSGSGVSGSANGTASLSDGKRNYGATTLFTTQLSPVSNSNLVFLRESFGTGTALSTCYLRMTGVFV